MQSIPSEQDVIDEVLGDVKNTIKLMKNVELDRIFSVLNKANNVIIYATGFTQNNCKRIF